MSKRLKPLFGRWWDPFSTVSVLDAPPRWPAWEDEDQIAEHMEAAIERDIRFRRSSAGGKAKAANAEAEGKGHGTHEQWIASARWLRENNPKQPWLQIQRAVAKQFNVKLATVCKVVPKKDDPAPPAY